MEKTVANRIAFAQTRDLLLEGQNVRICVQGQSMLPFFRSGSVITLRPLRHGDLRRGAVVMAETVQGNFVVHRTFGLSVQVLPLLRCRLKKYALSSVRLSQVFTPMKLPKLSPSSTAEA